MNVYVLMIFTAFSLKSGRGPLNKLHYGIIHVHSILVHTNMNMALTTACSHGSTMYEVIDREGV